MRIWLGGNTQFNEEDMDFTSGQIRREKTTITKLPAKKIWVSLSPSTV